MKYDQIDPSTLPVGDVADLMTYGASVEVGYFRFDPVETPEGFTHFSMSTKEQGWSVIAVYEATAEGMTRAMMAAHRILNVIGELDARQDTS